LVERAPEPGLFAPFIFSLFQAFGGCLKKTTPIQGGTLNALSRCM
jgi:hypothetical protein